MTEVLDVSRVKADFPIFERKINGKPLVYLDSASSSQKPRAVLDAMEHHHRHHYANVHRGIYTIAEESTAAYEGARAKVAKLLNARATGEIVFTKNITEAMNLVAYSWARKNLGPGDPVVITEMEHHANIVPWHILVEERGVELRWIPITDDFQLDLTDLDRLLDGAKLLSVTAMSNVLGTLNDIRLLSDAAHAAGALVNVDAAQAVPHLPVDVQAWDADFVGFTGHKMLGPTGLGGLWARAELLDAMPPFLGGGEMILDVRKDGYVPNEVPWKFEAGTMPIAEATGLAAAIDYLEALGMDAVREHERHLTQYALQAMRNRFGDRIHVHGPSGTEMRGGIVSFGFDHIHAHDISQVLDEDAICVRASHHCAKPLMRVLGVPANTRASFYVYNDEADVDALIDGLERAEKFFAI